MPLRPCSILGTVGGIAPALRGAAMSMLLALAFATPALAQGKEDSADEATSTPAKKKKKAKAKKSADDAETSAAAEPEAKADDTKADAQAKGSKRKGKGKGKKKDEEEEKKAEGEGDEADADKDKAAGATEASAAEAPAEPDAWEAPPEEEEKPPARVAPKPVDKPDHGGKPLSAGLIVGWGFETDRRSTSYSADPYGLGAGVRGGYSFDFNLYAGVYFMYYLGTAVTGSSQYVNNPTITTNANYMQFGLEGGYDWWVGPVIVRPSLQLGVAMAFTDVPNIASPISDFMFAPGVTVVHPWDDFFIGGDLRANVVTGDGTSSMLLAGTFGMRF